MIYFEPCAHFISIAIDKKKSSFTEMTAKGVVMYFIEHVFRLAIVKGIEKAIEKITETIDKKGPPRINKLKNAQIELLTELKTQSLQETIGTTGSSQRKLKVYLDKINDLCANAKTSSKTKAEELRIGDDSSKEHLELFDYYVNQFNQQILTDLKTDFEAPSAAKRITYQDHAFQDSELYTEESQDKNWLCHFIKGRFEYKVGKLAEFRITKTEKDINVYRQKLREFDKTFSVWEGIEEVAFYLQRLNSLSITPSSSARSTRKKGGSSSNPNWDSISRDANNGLEKLTGIINRLSFALVLYLKVDASDIQTSQSSTLSLFSFMNAPVRFIHQSLIDIGVLGAGTCSPIVTEFIDKFKPETQHENYRPHHIEDNTVRQYFYEVVLKQAMTSAIEAIYKKIDKAQNDRGHDPMLNPLRQHQLSQLNTLKSAINRLSIAIAKDGEKPGYDTFYESIIDVTESCRKNCEQKSEQLGFSVESNAKFETYISELAKILASLNADFSASATPFSFYEHKDKEARLYTHDGRGANWLCSFIKTRFDYQIGKLTEFAISKPTQNKEIYNQKIRSFDETVRCWSGLEKIFFIFRELEEKSSPQSKKTSLLSIQQLSQEGLEILESVKNQLSLALVFQFREDEQDIQLNNTFSIPFLNKLHASLTSARIVGRGSCASQINNFTQRFGTHVHSTSYAPTFQNSSRAAEPLIEEQEEQEYDSDYGYEYR